ncbi:MAG: hypothetical protein ACOZQL_41645 [Myxococcota bacterium]
MSTTTDGVHRLVDMVVEEVSLVDRAANLRRFLIVKRDEAMDDTERDAKKADSSDDSPLSAALAALENLTEIVEELGEDVSDPRVASLAEQLRAASEELLARAGTEEPGDEDTTKAAARPRRGKKPEPKAQDAAPEQPDPTSKVDLGPITEGLTKLTESFKALSESVTSQAQRLGRVEKQFGLPNSIPTQQQPPPKATEHEVAWPLDLNNPLDRDSVEKSLSFHES